MFITAIINLLSLTHINYREQELVSELNSFFNFDHNIFLTVPSVDINCFINVRSDRDTPRSLHIFGAVQDNLTISDALTDINSKNTFCIVAAGRAYIENDDGRLLSRIKEIQRLQIKMKLGLFLSETISSFDVQKMFEWFWTHRIVNIFIASQSSEGDSLNIFTFNPFGTFVVINVTGTKSLNNLFPSQQSNFQQYQLQVKWMKAKTQECDASLWQDFVFPVLNASFTKNYVDYTANRSELYENGTLDIFAGLSFMNDQPFLNIYPMSVQPAVIIVPAALPYEEFLAYLKTLTTDTLFSYCLTGIVAIVFALTFFRYIGLRKILFFQSAADVVNLLMNDNGAIKYELLSRSEVFVLVPLSFAGLIIVNGILSTFQSHLTRPLMQPQINTIEDIYHSPFKILIAHKGLASFAINVLNDQHKFGDWSGKISLVEVELLERHIKTFNTSTSLVVLKSTAELLSRLQKRLDIPGFHVTRTQVYKQVASYIVNDAFPFIERLNEIIHWVQAADLYEKCRRDYFSAVETNIARDYKSSVELQAADDRNSTFPMFVFYGWCLSGIVFVLEIIWKNFQYSKIFSFTRH